MQYFSAIVVNAWVHQIQPDQKPLVVQTELSREEIIQIYNELPEVDLFQDYMDARNYARQKYNPNLLRNNFFSHSEDELGTVKSTDPILVKAYRGEVYYLKKPVSILLTFNVENEIDLTPQKINVLIKDYYNSKPALTEVDAYRFKDKNKLDLVSFSFSDVIHYSDKQVELGQPPSIRLISHTRKEDNIAESIKCPLF